MDNHVDFVEDQDEWKDTVIVFDITETGNGTELRFTHAGLAPGLNCYDVHRAPRQARLGERPPAGCRWIESPPRQPRAVQQTLLLHAAWDGFNSVWVHLVVGTVSLAALLVTIYRAHRGPRADQARAERALR